MSHILVGSVVRGITISTAKGSCAPLYDRGTLRSNLSTCTPSDLTALNTLGRLSERSHRHAKFTNGRRRLELRRCQQITDPADPVSQPGDPAFRRQLEHRGELHRRRVELT